MLVTLPRTHIRAVYYNWLHPADPCDSAWCDQQHYRSFHTQLYHHFQHIHHQTMIRFFTSNIDTTNPSQLEETIQLWPLMNFNVHRSGWQLSYYHEVCSTD